MAVWGTNTCDPFWGCSSDSCAAAGELPEGRRSFLCTALSVQPLPLSLFAEHHGTQSSGAASCLIIPGRGGILHSHSWAGAILAPDLACSDQEPWADCADHALYLCGGNRGCWAGTSVAEHPAALQELEVRGFSPALMGTEQSLFLI